MFSVECLVYLIRGHGREGCRGVGGQAAVAGLLVAGVAGGGVAVTWGVAIAVTKGQFFQAA